MKRIYFLCLSFALFFNFLTGQNPSFGLSVGMGIANIDGISNSRIAGGLGFLTQYSLNDRFSIYANLGYVLKGGKIHVVEVGGVSDRSDSKFLTSFHTLSLDLAIDYVLFSGLKLGLGPYVAVMPYAQERFDATYTNNGETTRRVYMTSITDLYHPIDYGVVAQLQYQFSDAFSLGFRFRQGIRNAFAVELIPLIQRNQSLDLVANILLAKK